MTRRQKPNLSRWNFHETVGAAYTDQPANRRDHFASFVMVRGSHVFHHVSHLPFGRRTLEPFDV